MEVASLHSGFLHVYLISSADHTCDLLAEETFTASDRGGFARAGRFSSASFVLFYFSVILLYSFI